MTEKVIVDSPGGSAASAKTPENLIVVNPDQPPYSTEHLCIYLSELPELSPDGQDEPFKPFKQPELPEQLERLKIGG